MGTHLSFVRSSEYDKWSLRQLAKLEAGGNKRAREFFRQHGFAGAVDFSSSAAERWRNDLSARVEALYPAKTAPQEAKVPAVEAPKEPVVVVAKPHFEEVKTEVRPIVPAKGLYVPPTTGVTHKFRKAKTEEKKSTGFKAVSFRPEPDPLETPSTNHKPQRPVPVPVAPVPTLMERKPVEKKAFSSEDFEASRQDSAEVRAKLGKFKGAAAISSDDYFERAPLDHDDSSSVKDDAVRYAEVVAIKAGEVRAR
jgi:hypothetical protein